MKREPTIWENIFVNDTSEKGLSYKIYKKPIQLNTRNTNNPIKKWGKDLNGHLSKDIQRVHRHMEKCSKSLAIREMQIQNTLRYHLTAVRMAIINKLTNTKYWQGCGEKGTLVHYWWECRLAQPLQKIIWSFLKKLKMELPCDPAILLLGLYPKNPETPVQKNLCTPMFLAVLSTIAKCWIQPKCPSVNEWIKKWWYIYTMEYYEQKERRSSYPSQQQGWN